ncbi:MAG: glycosyltransferase family 2 protein [Acidimicrobiales bacterium]
MAIVAIQKNNPARWLADWARYHACLGFSRVLIYDNGSDDRDEVAGALSRVSTPSDIILVEWDFPFGIHRSYETTFAQWGALNHAYQMTSRGSWLANFDVDEYLALDGQIPTLQDFLRRVPPWFGELVTYQHRVPAASNVEKPLPERCATDFTWRYPDEIRKVRKYMIRGGTARLLRVHQAELRRPFRSYIAEPETLSYLHYDGLNSNWKGEGRNQIVPIRDMEGLVRDERVLTRMAQLR